MTTITHSAILQGLIPILIEVEVQQTPGLPALTIIGLASKAVGEAKERLTTALNFGRYPIKHRRTVINLAPADLQKTSPALDLAMITGVLAANQLLPPIPKTTLLLGEVSLTGELKKVRAALPIVSQAKKLGFTEVIFPQGNCDEVGAIENVKLLPARNLAQVVDHLINIQPLPVLQSRPFSPSILSHTSTFDDIVGQEAAKRALTIAIAGQHHILLLGPPGTGKTALAQAAANLQPPLAQEELIESQSIYAVAGHNHSHVRPFRAPHHTISHTGLLGGGPQLLPGEISLAHHGILFLDELPEFSRRSLEALRQPLESNQVTVTRAQGSTTYPANFTLVAAANSCPCGYYGSQTKSCTCPPGVKEQYFKKISGPLLDRIALTVWVENTSSLLKKPPSNPSSLQLIKQQIIWAQHKQKHQKPMLNIRHMLDQKLLNVQAKKVLHQAEQNLQLSPRSLLNLIKVAQTIAHLEDHEQSTIKDYHLYEALRYRFKLN